uniref:DUF243 domain-containing protein n=1 Tax=Glossina brevipalpis TaxID=37001 RepID=A0A1A9WQM7_9MUSC
MGRAFLMIMLMRIAVLLCLRPIVSSAPQGYHHQLDFKSLVSNLNKAAITQINERNDNIYNSPIYFAPSHYSSPSKIGRSSITSEQYHTLEEQPFVTKDIYLHLAPEYPHEQKLLSHLTVPKKHYRIVFIKSPTSSLSEDSAHFKQAAKEEKTIIYVLNRKHDPLEFQDAIEKAVNKEFSKPEVFFIKYNTQEEAARAQQAIQAQYEKLGGTTQISDEIVAPVINAVDDESVSTVTSSERR